MDKKVRYTSDLPGEVWAKLPGFSRYEVSSVGRIRSFTDNSGKVKGNPTYLLKPAIGKRGYLKITVIDDNMVRRCTLLHQLIALGFIGPRPGTLQVCHNDGNKLNNNASNLRYDTQENNMLDAINHGTIRRGVGVNTNVLDEEEVVVIRKLYHVRGIGLSLLSKVFGISASQVRAIVYGKHWKHNDKYMFKDHRIHKRPEHVSDNSRCLLESQNISEV